MGADGAPVVQDASPSIMQNMRNVFGDNGGVLWLLPVKPRFHRQQREGGMGHATFKDEGWSEGHGLDRDNGAVTTDDIGSIIDL